jgi:hypothetical protein
VSSTVSRLLAWVIAFLIGAVYGTAGTIAHAYRLGGWPVGLVLAVIGFAALLIAMRALTTDRWTALCGGVGALLATVVFSGAGPGGSVIVPQGGLDELFGVSLGLVWAIAVAFISAVAVAWPDLSALRRRG